MATTKAAAKPDEKEEAQKPAEAAPAETAEKEQAPAEKTEPKGQEPKTAQKKTVKVMNPHMRFHYVHPASGVRLGAGEVKELIMDPWLEMQIKAGVLKEV